MDLSERQADQHPVVPLAVLERDGLSWHEKVALLGWWMHCNLPSAVPEVKHIFQPGWYIRQMTMPAGQLFVGRIHRQGHLLKLIAGRAMWLRPDGRFIYDAPATVQTAPGSQVVAVSITEVVVQSLHVNPDDSRDIQQLEEDAFEPPESTLALGKELMKEPKWLAQ